MNLSLQLRPTVLLMLALVPCVASAAEIRLRTRCEVQVGIVHLGDVADITSASADDSAALAGIELFPAPAAGKSRYATLREIHDALVLRGINLSQHTMAGASRVALIAESPTPRPTAAKVTPPPQTRVNQRQVLERLRAAIVAHLVDQAGAEFAQSCRIDLRLSEEIAREIAGASASPLQASGGVSPWLGQQHFTICSVDSPDLAWQLTADISQSPLMVVAKRPLARGTILGPLDVELVSREETTRISDPLRELELALGRELLQTVAAGQALSAEQVRAPILVRRGDPVTVYARANGLQVRVTARAQDEGSLGDMVTVESFNDRRRFLARVCGLQEVEIMVGPTASTGSAVTSAAAPNHRQVTDSRSTP
jgi:flagella basal body P-ring formation protein FlgA